MTASRRNLSRKELKEFRGMLVELRKKLAHNVTHLENEALRNEGQTISELSDMPVDHLADRGSDNFAKDLLIGVMQSSEAEICDIDIALDKIEEGTYGICEHCGLAIQRNRLRALAFARLCIECKGAEERRSASL